MWIAQEGGWVSYLSYILCTVGCIRLKGSVLTWHRFVANKRMHFADKPFQNGGQWSDFHILALFFLFLTTLFWKLECVKFDIRL